MRRRGDTTPPPPGGRVAARKQLFVEQRYGLDEPRPEEATPRPPARKTRTAKKTKRKKPGKRR